MDKPTQDRRIEALEAALRDAVDYLSRLPVVPVTRAKMRELQDVLDESTPPPEREREAMCYTPSGVPAVSVIVLGDRVWVRIPELDRKSEAAVCEHLRRGVCMPLEQRPSAAPLTEREQELWHRRR